MLCLSLRIYNFRQEGHCLILQTVSLLTCEIYLVNFRVSLKPYIGVQRDPPKWMFGIPGTLMPDYDQGLLPSWGGKLSYWIYLLPSFGIFTPRGLHAKLRPPLFTNLHGIWTWHLSFQEYMVRGTFPRGPSGVRQDSECLGLGVVLYGCWVSDPERQGCTHCTLICVLFMCICDMQDPLQIGFRARSPHARACGRYWCIWQVSPQPPSNPPQYTLIYLYFFAQLVIYKVHFPCSPLGRVQLNWVSARVVVLPWDLEDGGASEAGFLLQLASLVQETFLGAASRLLRTQPRIVRSAELDCVEWPGEASASWSLEHRQGGVFLEPQAQ